MEENQQPAETTVSNAKIEANRRNPLKSTGPRTERGKVNVRFNAVKHGFFAKQVIQSLKIVGEDWKEFQNLLQGLMEHYEPVGTAEELLVQQIAVGLWRERQALRCEMGEIERVRTANAPDVPSRYADVLERLQQGEQELDRTGELTYDTRVRLMTYFDWELLEDFAVRKREGEEAIAERRQKLLEKIRAKMVEIRDYSEWRQQRKSGR